MSLPATIQTAVGPSLIGKVGRLFNGSLTDVLNELLQNARRAGATRVDIEVAESDGCPALFMRDNGSGIADPTMLVTLGESGWDDRIARREDPAGMGVFSLAGHRVEVRSFSTTAECGWRVTIAADAWDTGAALAIEPFAITGGTEILIDLPDDWLRTLDATVARCVRHYPLAVFLRGDLQPSDDFLAGATHVEEWQGCRIGIFRGLGTHPLDCPRINFHGVTVPCTLPNVQETDQYQPWGVKVDIVDAPMLQLVLPARKELVQNEALSALCVAAETAIFRAIALGGRHRLAFKDWQRAQVLGVDLPEAEPWLDAWEPLTADGHGPPSGARVANEPMLVMGRHEPDIDQCAARILKSGKALGGRMVRAMDSLAGYSWYDALPRIADIAFSIEVDGGRYRYGDGDILPPEVRSGRATRIELDVVVEYPSLLSSRIEHGNLPTDALVCRNDGFGNLDEAIVLVADNATIDPNGLAWLIEAVCFCPDEDHDSDSWDTQRRDFEKSARHLANELLLGEEQALLDRLRSAVADELIWLIPKGRKISLTASQDEVNLAFVGGEATA